MRITHELTDAEGHVLAQIARNAPITAYELRMLFARSPVAALSSSTGTVYPIVRRLREQGLVTSQAVEGDRRGTERLDCTAEGKAALRDWLRAVRTEDLLLHDPLRTRMLFLGELSRADQLRWLRSVRVALNAKAAEFDQYAARRGGFYEELAYANARDVTRTRIAWIEAAIAAIDPSEARRVDPDVEPVRDI